jgi:hypothetical protein
MFQVSRTRPVRSADNLTAVCRLSRQCGILNISQPYRPLYPFTGMLYFLYFLGQLSPIRAFTICPVQNITQTVVVSTYVP